MLLHLIEHAQLKKPIKGLAKNAWVLVTEKGHVIAPLPIPAMTITASTGPVMATFDYGQMVSALVSMDAEYTQLFELLNSKWKNAKVVFAALKTAQSLTIRYVEQTFELERDEAKELITALVARGAYTKYYSYWRQTSSFRQWLSARKDGA